MYKDILALCCAKYISMYMVLPLKVTKTKTKTKGVLGLVFIPPSIWVSGIANWWWL